MENKDIEKVGKSILNKLMSGDAKESSKRALAIYIVVVLGTIITCYSLYKGVDYIILLGVWLSFAGTLLVNLILGYWLYDIQHNTDTTNLKKLERSRGREEMLVKQDSLKAIELKEIQHENRIKDSLLLLKPKEIIIIKDHYYEKADIVLSLSYDSSLLYLSDRLQGVDID